MNKRSSFIPFITGIVLGVLAAVYLPGYVRPYLPDWLAGKETVVTGTVTAKQRKDRTLLLTANTQQGAVLVTITKKVDEVDLLVSEGNTLEFALKAYSPFVDDPRITRVAKSAQASPPEPAKAVAASGDAGPPPGDKGAREEKTQRQKASIPAGAASKTAPPAKLPAAK
jgi:hypothetical protein